MKIQKIYSAAILVLFLTFSSSHQLCAQSEWRIVKPSTLTVVATSNISTITCKNPTFEQKDPIVFTPNGSITKMQGRITMPVNDLNCQNRFYNNNMRKTLKAEKNPNLQIRFFEIDDKLDFSGNFDKKDQVKVEITLAGVTKPYVIPIQFQKKNNGTLILSGTNHFNLSDFQMEPPNILGGLVEVNDPFTVIFELHLKTQ